MLWQQQNTELPLLLLFLAGSKIYVRCQLFSSWDFPPLCCFRSKPFLFKKGQKHSALSKAEFECCEAKKVRGKRAINYFDRDFFPPVFRIDLLPWPLSGLFSTGLCWFSIQLSAPPRESAEFQFLAAAMGRRPFKAVDFLAGYCILTTEKSRLSQDLFTRPSTIGLFHIPSSK